MTRAVKEIFVHEKRWEGRLESAKLQATADSQKTLAKAREQAQQILAQAQKDAREEISAAREYATQTLEAAHSTAHDITQKQLHDKDVRAFKEQLITTIIQ